MLTPVLALIGQTVLATPDLTHGRIEQIWDITVGLADTCYVLLVIIGGMLVMGYETVQSRWAAKQIGGKLLFAFLAANCSLLLVRQLLSFVNALVGALFAQDVSAAGIGDRLTGAILDSIFLPDGTTDIFMVLLGLALAVMAVAVLCSFALRTAALLLLVVCAPLMLSCHALPVLDGVARLWWRCVGAVFAIQLLQATVLMLMVQVFFDPDADVFGLPTASGLTDLLVCCALFVILLKIPGWMRRIALGRGGGGLVSTVLRAATFAAVGSTLGVGPASSVRGLTGRLVGNGVARRFASGPVPAGPVGGATRRAGPWRRALTPPRSQQPRKDAHDVDMQKEYPGDRGQIPGQLALFPVPRGARKARPKSQFASPEPEPAASAVYPGQIPLFPLPTSGYGRQQPLFKVPKEWRADRRRTGPKPQPASPPAATAPTPAVASAAPVATGGPRYVQPGLFSPTGKLYRAPVKLTPGQAKQRRIEAARRRAAALAAEQARQTASPSRTHAARPARPTPPETGADGV